MPSHIDHPVHYHSPIKERDLRSYFERTKVFIFYEIVYLFRNKNAFDHGKLYLSGWGVQVDHLIGTLCLFRS